MSQNPYAPPKSESSYIPYATKGELELASLWLRFVGAFLDGFIMLLLIFPISIGLAFALSLTGINPDEFQFTEPNEILLTVLLTVLDLALGLGVFFGLNGYLLATRGQTIGKYLLGTQIQTENGQLVPFVPLIWKRYIIVWVVSQIPYFGIIASFGNVLLIFRANRKCLHDEIAGTKVVVLNQ